MAARIPALMAGLGAALLASCANAEVGGSPGTATASDRAAVDYELHCSGCHKADGAGLPGYVPALKGQVGRFLRSPAGRSYVLRVPGVSQSLLPDKALADVMNFVVRTFDPEDLPGRLRPFSAAEIGHARRTPITDTGAERRRLLALPAEPDPGWP